MSVQRLALAAFLVLASTLAGAMVCRHAADEASAQTAASIDAQVLEDTAGGGTGHFLVVLVPQADTRQAADAARHFEARGHSVVEALRWEAKASQPAVGAALDAFGARYRAYWIVNAFAVEGGRAVVEAMAARPDVAAIESDRAFQVDLERPTAGSAVVAPLAPSAIEWNVSWINAPAMWAQGYTGQGQILANADTGVRWEHPALKSHYRGWNGSTADHNYNWWDAIHSDISGNGSNPCGFSSPVPCDDSGHGTHTTGTAVGDDGAGNQVGVAPGAAWIACRNMDEGVGRPSTYIECMQFFMAPTDLNGQNPDPNRRPHAVGNSYICPPVELCEAHSLQTALENLRAAGVFMAASAGNSGPGCSTIDSPPALEDSAITVGATGFQTDVIASYSSRGPVTVDGSNRRKPDLVAPGSAVRSSYPPEGYATLSGTSMASPHVAGAVLLLWSAVPSISRAVDFTEFLLGQTAMHLTSDQGCGGDSSSQVPNNVYGHGRIDVLAAYGYASQSAPVGGIAELPELEIDPMADSGEAAIPCTVVVAGVVVVAASAWYARRRWGTARSL